MRPSLGSRDASRSARTAGPVVPEASRRARSSVATEGTVPAMGSVETPGEVRFQGRGGRSFVTGEHPCGVSRWSTAVRKTSVARVRPCAWATQGRIPGRPRNTGPRRHRIGRRARRPGCGRSGLRCSRGRTRHRANTHPSSSVGCGRRRGRGSVSASIRPAPRPVGALVDHLVGMCRRGWDGSVSWWCPGVHGAKILTYISEGDESGKRSFLVGRPNRPEGREEDGSKR